MFEINQDKRKATAEHLEQQPPHKKIATDGPMVESLNNSLPSPLGDTDAGPSSSSGQIPTESISGIRNRGGRSHSQNVKISAVLHQVWNDDLDSGHLLVSLFELFGESIFNFIPTPEMSVFV